MKIEQITKLCSIWLSQLAYLFDVLSSLNELNASLEDRNITPFIAHDKINTILMKLQFSIKDLDRGNIQSFPTLENFIMENELALHHDLFVDIK